MKSRGYNGFMSRFRTIDIGQFFMILGSLMILIMVVLLALSVDNISKQFNGTNFLMEYSSYWNDIFISMLEVSGKLELFQRSLDAEAISQYLQSSENLDAAIDAFILAYDEDAETWNVLRRLQAFNDYQEMLISNACNAAEIFHERQYVSSALDLHTDEILSLYRSQMDKELGQYAIEEHRILQSIVMCFSMTMLFMLVISAIYIWFAMFLRRAINKAVDNLDEISLREWKTPDLTGARFEEFIKLFAGINRLKRRLHTYFLQLKEATENEKRLLDEKLKSEKAQRMLVSSEMELLRSQVNPHFLFNSLTQIGMAALINEPRQVLDMVECTGRILRYSLYNKERMVKLDDELSIVETYVRLHQMGASDNLSFSIVLSDESLRSMMIIPMCIQPVVENCLKHAMPKDRRSLEITISVGFADGCTVVSVRDDGVGIESPDKILSSHKNRIGLSNIQRRLELQYGVKGLLSIDSIPGKYTEVVIRFPEETGDEGSDNRG